MSVFRPVLLFAMLLPLNSVADESLTIAVASNFRTTAELISTEFTKTAQTPVRISSGSTGNLYAQIVNGAPYDIFLAADVLRPQLLENDGVAVSGSRVTYATGSLVLWSADRALANQGCFEALKSAAYRRIAIANPATAPYGRAAKEFLQAAGVFDEAAARMVYGENISQTLHFVVSGNATLGLIAVSQVAEGLPLTGSCSWKVPRSMHTAIDQQAVLLRNSRNPVAAQKFMDFLRTPQVTAILERRGYTVPE